MRRVLWRAVTFLWPVVLWLGLWRGVSWANLVSGLVVAGAAWRLGGRRGVAEAEGRELRPVGLVVFVGRFVVDLVVATARVAAEVVTPRWRGTPGLVEVPLRCERPGTLALVGHAVTLTPGTITVDAMNDPPRLVVHALHLTDAEALIRSVRELEGRVVAAVGTPAERAALGADRGAS